MSRPPPLLALPLLFGCRPDHPQYTASPCVAAYDDDFDADAMIGDWSVPPCEGESEETCQVRPIEVDGDPRCYLQPMPDHETAGLPLLIVWHGSYSNGASVRRAFNGDVPGLALEDALEGEAVVVYPDGRAHDDCGGNTCWDGDPEGPDVAFFEAIVTSAVAEWDLDPARISSVGHSRGGRFTEVLGCYRGDEHAAIAMLSAGAGNVAACPDSVPVWLSHSEDDETIPYRKGLGHLDHWAARNGCDEPDVDDVSAGTCVELPGCEQPVTWCPTEGGAWGGHAPPALADEELWGFLSAQ